MKFYGHGVRTRTRARRIASRHPDSPEDAKSVRSALATSANYDQRRALIGFPRAVNAARYAEFRIHADGRIAGVDRGF